MSVSTFNFMSFVFSDFILEWIIYIRKVFKTVGAIHLSKTVLYGILTLRNLILGIYEQQNSFYF